MSSRNSHHDIENLPLPKITNETWAEAILQMKSHLKIDFNQVRNNLYAKIGIRLASEWLFSYFYHLLEELEKEKQ